jgi:hypothetical protein
MVLVVPLVIQIQGNEVRVGIGTPPHIVNQPIPASDHAPPNTPRYVPDLGQLHRMLLNPSLN